jgi:hypothetical protein
MTRRLLRLYPRWWRERYGEEFGALIDDLSGTGPTPWLVADIVRGAVDARLRKGLAMFFKDPAVRRGIYDGLIISGLLAVVIVLTNVVFPVGPGESDDDPEYLLQLLATAAALAGLFLLVGARGRRRLDSPSAGTKAGLAAGIVVAVMVTITFVVMNNAFWDVISQQHDKQVAFAASGWSSMRAYISIRQVEGLVVVVPVFGAFGAVLGLIGGLVGPLLGRSRQPTT